MTRAAEPEQPMADTSYRQTLESLGYFNGRTKRPDLRPRQLRQATEADAGRAQEEGMHHG